jgi:hypothetical protein
MLCATVYSIALPWVAVSQLRLGLQRGHDGSRKTIRVTIYQTLSSLLGHKGFRERRDGERKKKAIRGCIVDNKLSVLACAIVKKGEKEIAGLTGGWRGE